MTGIPYCDEVWNVTAGCTKCAPGCKNCWAEKWAARLAHIGQRKYQDVVDGNYNNWFLPKWNNKVYCDESILEQPLHWKKPRRIFVCSMSDLFHPRVPFEYMAEIFLIAQKCSTHTFLFFTKRIKRALEFYEWDYPLKLANSWGQLKNIQLILSLSTQKEADEKIPTLLQIPAAVRGLSIEPMLEPLNIIRWLDYGGYEEDWGIRWVIVGCESGSNRRPCKIDWVRSIVQQCKAANVPVYVKQLSINGKVSRNPKEWPEDLRVQQYPKK